MEKQTKDSLIKELNQLSENFEKNKQRMIEIARILLHDHYGYKKNQPIKKNGL